MLPAAPSSKLSHVDADGAIRMVDVGDKQSGSRRASARAVVTMSPSTAAQVVAGSTRKGNVIAVCRIAGIQAAKRTAELIPLAHQVPLSHVDVDVDVDVDAGEATIQSSVRSVSGTGVEIEALTAVSIAAVTMYDMIKAVDRGATITGMRVTAKSGGRSGSFAIDPASGELAAVAAGDAEGQS